LAQEPRQLPSRYLYDALGSALFEAICRLPWYRITRAERRLVSAYGPDVLRALRPSRVVELGSGSGEKLRVLLQSRDDVMDPVDVHFVDVSASALATSEQALQALQNVRVFAHQMAYEEGLIDSVWDRGDRDRALVLFLGSNIGNSDPPDADAFLRGVRAHLRAGDGLLLGADLVKPEDDLRRAYEDPLGVTAAFNRNLLVRINRELSGNFDVMQFAHRAVWNGARSRIEMHLVAQSRQDIRIPAADAAFAMEAGSIIWTESSYKFRAGEVVRLLEDAGFRAMEQWVDRIEGFALTLAEVA
jgi:dimethylhistidine N-methyltransferase